MSIDNLHQTVVHLISQYGSFGLFTLLAFGIIGLPIPDETLLVVSGFMIANGEMPLITTILAAVFGAMTGITVSYLLGRTLGHRFVVYIGKYIGLTPKKLDYAHHWFERIGKWLLILGYFIPGVRHFIGIIAGITELDYKRFAIFAYTGVLIWCACFLSFGYFAYDQWQHWKYLF